MAFLLSLNPAVPTSVAAGAASPVGAIAGFTITLESVGTATYQLQISCDPTNPPNANSWQNEGAALTAAGVLQVTKYCYWIRWNCTAYTSGTPVARVAALQKY